MNGQRLGMVIGVRPAKLRIYGKLRAQPWPEMNAALSASSIQSYLIFLREAENWLLAIGNM